MTPVAINGRFLTRPATGVDRFAAELLRAWLAAGPRDVTTLVPRGTRLADTAGLDPALLNVLTVGRFGGHPWEQLELGPSQRDRILLDLCNSGPVLRRRQLAVLHDVGFIVRPGTYSRAFRTWYRLLFRGLVRRADIVATVSAFSAGEIAKHVGRRARGIELIPGAGEHILRPQANTSVLDRLGLGGRRYVLAVGSRTPNKNLDGVLRAFAGLHVPDLALVAAGGTGGRAFNAASASGDGAITTGYVSDGELRALYESAACFVFPSFYEGFGLPPLEAMHCGCPVVVSSRASLPEVCGDAAVYCDPDDPSDIARALERVLTSTALQDELREAGRSRAGSFSWRSSADALDALL